jgi:hypothetical protein
MQTFRGRGASLLEPMVFNIPGSKLDRTTCNSINSIYMSASTQGTTSLHNHERPWVIIECNYANQLFRRLTSKSADLGLPTITAVFPSSLRFTILQYPRHYLRETCHCHLKKRKYTHTSFRQVHVPATNLTILTKTVCPHKPLYTSNIHGILQIP